MPKCLQVPVLTVLILSCVGSSAVAGETVDSVEKKLATQWSKVKSLSAKLRMEGVSDSMTGVGVYQLLKKGDRTTYRMDMSLGEEIDTTTISDGEFILSITDHRGQKLAMKMRPDETQVVAPTAQLAQLRASHDLKLLPEQTVSGQAVYVIEATPKHREGHVGRTIFYYAKETGVPVRMTVYSASGQLLSDMTLSEIEINPALDPSRFAIKPPPGVELMDMTKR